MIVHTTLAPTRDGQAYDLRVLRHAQLPFRHTHTLTSSTSPLRSLLPIVPLMMHILGHETGTLGDIIASSYPYKERSIGVFGV